MIKLIKTLTSATLLAVVFTACSTAKIPFEQKKETELKVANKCQVLKKKEEKVLCYKKISSSNSVAQLRLGINSLGEKKYEKALKLLTSAKENGNYHANMELAYLYFKGLGVTKDTKRSISLLEESSPKDVRASFQLAILYFEGLGVEKNKEKALKLVEFSANKNMLPAQKFLAVMYAKGGHGIVKNEEKFNFWLKKAKANKNDTSLDIYKL